MSTPHSLAARFREVLLDGTWIANTNFRDQLTQTSFADSIKAVSPLNTIADLTRHIHYYIRGVKEVLEGSPLRISDRFAFDFPSLSSEQEWADVLTALWADAEDFARLVEALPTAQLQQPFVEEKYGTYDRNIEGMIEHCYYHLGQIVQVRKLVLLQAASSPASR
jgi:hypothetical protein